MLDFDDSDEEDIDGVSDGEKNDSSDAVEIAQLFRKPEQEQAIESQSGLLEAAGPDQS